MVYVDAARQGTLSINHPSRNVEQEFEFDGLFPGETSQEKVRLRAAGTWRTRARIVPLITQAGASAGV